MKNSSLFTFYAKVNKSFVKPLQQELKQMGVEPESMINMNKQGLNYIRFRSNFKSIWKIMLYSRLIEGLKIQIAENVKAMDERTLKVNLNSVAFEKYLPMQNSTDFRMPVVKAYSYRSKLYHEKMIENIVMTSLNKLAYKSADDKDEREQRKLKVNTSVSEEEIIEKLQKRKNLKDLPRIDIIFQNDKFRVLLDLLNKPLHMHGYKNIINWGSLRETFAAALIYESQIVDKFYETRNLFVWDPFCGSGTILIELFLLATERHIRPIGDISKEAFTNLPFHNRQEFKEFIEEEKDVAENKSIVFRHEHTDIHLIGSDSDVKSVDALSKNSTKAGLNSYIVKSGDQVLNSEGDPSKSMNLAINPTIYHEKINNVFHSFIGDFENIAKEVVFNEKIQMYCNKKFTIFSNIPYGTSKEMSDKVLIKSLYKRFGKFLRKYSNNLEDVFILVNKRESKDELNFKNLSEIQWDTVSTFFNNGIEVELIKMRRELK